MRCQSLAGAVDSVLVSGGGPLVSSRRSPRGARNCQVVKPCTTISMIATAAATLNPAPLTAKPGAGADARAEWAGAYAWTVLSNAIGSPMAAPAEPKARILA